MLPALRPEIPEAWQRDASFTAIFESEFAYVWKALMRLGVQPRDLEDITHDVFVHVHRKLADYDPARPIRPWLFAFAFRAASEYRRRGRNRFEILVETDPADDAPSADEYVAAKENRALVAAALATMELGRRAVFVAHDLDDCSIPDIAAALKIPVSTAYSRLRLARQQFTQSITRLRARQKQP